MTRRAALPWAVALVLAAPATAGASEIVTRNAVGPSLRLQSSGQALVSWRGGAALVWGAVDARPPTRGVPQVRFRKRYVSGRTLAAARRTANRCRRYTGPLLANLVASCDAPDGSFWAVQRWQRLKPNHGGTSAAAELHVSHWRGAPPELTLYTDWIYGRFDQVFGTYTFHGTGIGGFRSTGGGVPLDGYGRNVYLDALDAPAYGPGWHRDLSFLVHRPHGTFCNGLYRWKGRSTAGKAYRVTAIGPGVAPDVTARSLGLGRYDAEVEGVQDALRVRLMAGDSLCRQR